ncbi:BQ2448_2711 [Microbotryum intermedium]|uniref:CCR4-Not complex 3'-5'-exoribonuclease subunit Ccr4 n=1 Tax=Microbotryum intermedium TaxID=269621 RepID=A0A238FGJ8_9BASI|nr:BQ2448_2711 [Microbotryum intermedium]
MSCHHTSLPPHSHSPHPAQGPGTPLSHSSHHPHQPVPHHQKNGAGNNNLNSQTNNNNLNNTPSSHHHPQQSSGAQPNGAQGPLSSHWQQQLSLAHISRQSNSPHHNARAAHLAARGHTNSSAAVVISDPSQRPSSTIGAKLSYGANLANGPGKNASTASKLFDDERTASVGTMRTENTRESGSSPTTAATELALGGPASLIDTVATNKADQPTWSTIDMGGMNLKNLAPELFRYTFLTTLYIPHNSLSVLPPSISRLSNLVLLDASSNKLTSLPVEIGLLTRLRELFLFDNHLQSLPPELGTLHQLDTLGIEGNPLPDTLRSLLEKDGTSALIAYLRDSCPVPLPPPERDWVTVEPDSFPTAPALNADGSKRPPEETFSALCYNILCEKYATSQMYGYTPSWALNWEYRKELILQEIMTYGADLICLQEVDVEQYESYFLEHLSGQDYDGVYYPKSRARTMHGEERKRVDGCATFFKNTTFALVEQVLIEFQQIAMRRPDFKKTEDMFNRVMTKDNIAVVTCLEHRASGARLVVANTHVHSNPDFRDVKLVQVAMMMDEVHKIANDFAKLPSRLNLGEGYDAAPKYANGSKIPTLICGDFNSVPDSGVYEFMTKGQVEKDHDDFMGHTYGNYTSEGLTHRLSLKSAYGHVGELDFTNYTPGFEGVLDYLFYTTNSLSVTGLLGHVDSEYTDRVVGFPNAHFPSDHISVLAEFKLKNT